MNGTIYVLTNKVNGKRYVGRTTLELKERINAHIQSSKTPDKGQPIHKAIAKYGIDSFNIESFSAPIDSLTDLEEDMIKRLNTINNGYNATRKGIARKLVYRHGSRVISIRMDRVLHDKLKERASKKGITLSVYINKVLEGLLLTV